MDPQIPRFGVRTKMVRIEADVPMLAQCAKYGKAPEKMTGTAKSSNSTKDNKC